MPKYMKSIVYNEDVFNKLLSSLTKNAQDSGLSESDIADAKQKDTISIAKKLVSNLAAELSNNIIQPNITSSTESNLDVKNLQNIDVFLKFLADNKIMIDGERLVLSKEEFEAFQRPEGYYPFSSKTKRVDTDPDLTRQWNVVDFIANKQLLIKYIQYLQQKAHLLQTSQNPDEKPYGQVLEIMLGKLITSVNASFGGTNLFAKPKSEPGKPKELSPDTVIDAFSNKIISTMTPNDHYDPKGPFFLKAKDLTSAQSLNAWLMQDPPAQIIFREGQGFKTVEYKQGAQLNPCTMMQALYQRAENKITASDEQVKIKNFYVEKIKQITTQYKGPDGNVCQLTTVSGPQSGTGTNSGTSSTDQSGKPGSQTGKGTGQPGQDVDTDSATLSRVLPFSMKDINLNRILNFLDTYKKMKNYQLTSPSDKEFVKNEKFIRDAINIIRTRHAKNEEAASEFTLFTDPVQFSYYSAIPSSNNYLPLVDGLTYIVQNTISCIKSVMSFWANKNDPFYQNLESQVSIGESNMNSLQYLRARSNDVIRPRNK